MTDQRKRFADRYFETLNATQSAIYAGYSDISARSKASQLLDEDEVQLYLSNLKSEYAEKIGVTREKWLNELSFIGFSNVQDFIDEGNSIRDISNIDRDKASSVSFIKKTVIEGDFGVKEVVEFKLHDKLSALDKIGRHLGFFSVDNEQSKPQTQNIINLGTGNNPNEVTD